jgi:hypothetical protein
MPLVKTRLEECIELKDYIHIKLKKYLDADAGSVNDYTGYFIVGLFCYICSFLLFVWSFFFTYALLAVVYVSHNTPRL